MEDISAADQRARRQMELALLLLKGRPVNVWDIASQIEDYDHSADSATLYKLVDRDIAELADLGIVVHPEGVDHRGRRSWRIDEKMSCVGKEFTQEAALYARLLGEILTAQVNDDSLMYRDYLRGAIVKLIGPLEHAGVHLPAQASKLSPIQKKLIEAGVRHDVLEFGYTDAQGRQSTRKVECYGSYLLRGHVYLVGRSIGTQCVPNENGGTKPQVDGQIVDDGIRRYRDDRLLGMPKVRGTFVPQADFDGARWVLLPFQIGPSQGRVCYAVPAERRGELRRVIRPQDALVPCDDGTGAHELRVEGYAQAELAARWALVEGIVPVAPQQVVECYRKALDQARAATYLCASLSDGIGTQAEASTPAKRRGRPSSAETSSQLFRLYALLSHAGSVRVSDVVASLDVSEQRAQELLGTLMTTIVDAGYLPIWYDERDESYRLLQQESFESTRLRLTPSEARAVEEALEKAQVAEGLQAELEVVRRALWPTQPVVEAMRTLAPGPQEERPSGNVPRSSADTDPLLTTLEVLSQALRERQQVTFSYRGVKDDAPRGRSVLPLNLFSRSGYFYLSALDMERQAERQFRTDRMDGVSSCDLSASKRRLVQELSRRLGGAWLDEAPRVTLRFDDPSWAELFEWEGMDVPVQGADGHWYATIPDLGGSWLPRHMVACAPDLSTTDPSLAARARAYAQTL